MLRLTKASNVYSFLVVLLELLTGKSPVSDGDELAKWALSYSSRLDDGEQIIDRRMSKDICFGSRSDAIGVYSCSGLCEFFS